MKYCTFFLFFVFVEFQLYTSLPVPTQLNQEKITSVKKSVVRQEKFSQDWSHIATLMNTIDKKEDKESLDKRGSKNFIGFFQAHY